MSSEFEGAIKKNGQNGIYKKMGGFFDYKILPINSAGRRGGIGGERKDNNGPQKSGQPIFNPAADGHIP